MSAISVGARRIECARPTRADKVYLYVHRQQQQLVLLLLVYLALALYYFFLVLPVFTVAAPVRGDRRTTTTCQECSSGYSSQHFTYLVYYFVMAFHSLQQQQIIKWHGIKPYRGRPQSSYRIYCSAVCFFGFAYCSVVSLSCKDVKKSYLLYIKFYFGIYTSGKETG